MLKISIVTVFPNLFEEFFKTSLVSRAQQNGLVQFQLIKFSDFCLPKERIDEPTCGPGAGMIIKPDVIKKAIDFAQDKFGAGYKIFFTPSGERLTQNKLKEVFAHFDIIFSSKKSLRANGDANHIILICTRYEGIDARVEEKYANLSLSIGDYVLMGGDLPAQVFIEGLLRLIPSVVGKDESVEHESFSGAFLDFPEYGLPVEWEGARVPEIVLSGNHAAIKKWREEQAVCKTVLNRFDWFRAHANSQNVALAKQFIPPHYLALMHTDVMVTETRIGNTSITTIDLHDIARSSATYGLQGVFMVQPLKDQQEIMKTFTDFWMSAEGQKYNKSRYEAVKLITALETFEDVIKKIEQLHEKKPVVIATSAKSHGISKLIDYSSQGIVWKEDRPVLFLFGTGRGLSEELLAKCDYMLKPVMGMSSYNHLSVRSAVGIILDRWLGLN